jgi:hypothetical protein
MDSLHTQSTSIFSNSSETIQGGFVNNVGALSISLIPTLVLIVLFGYVGYYGYMHPEKYKSIIGSMLLYFHLGKNNEIHTTEIPEQSNTYSLLSMFGIKPVSKDDLLAY